MIPVLELKTQYAAIQQEVEEAALRVLRSTRYILGPEVQAFEEEFAAWNGVSHALGVGNGTDAIQTAVRALGIGPGDEVICPAHTFIATAGAVALAGATPVFADIDIDTFTLNPQSVEKAITPKTKAIIAVHIYGHAAPVIELKEIADRHGLYLIEDCAQATGCTVNGKHVGSFGICGCFSFFPSKNLGGIGDGGMIITNDDDFFENAQMVHNHGSKVRYYHDMIGTNTRLDEIQAAVLRVKLKHVNAWNERRRAIAAAYNKGLEGVAITPVERPNCYHVYHQYTVRVPERDRWLKHLNDNGVGAVIYYPIELHLQKAFANTVPAGFSLPVSEKAMAEVLSLPMFPELTEEQITFITDTFKQFKP